MPSLTQIKQYAIEEGKKIIYLVLKKKPLSAEIIEKLSGDSLKRLEEYLISIIPALQKINPQDPEKVLKYISLQATLKILFKIMNDNYLTLSENDRILAEKIYNNDKEKEKEKEKENEKIEEDNQQNEKGFEADNSNSNTFWNICGFKFI